MGRAQRARRAGHRAAARPAHAARARIGRGLAADDGEHPDRLDHAADRARAVGLLRARPRDLPPARRGDRRTGRRSAATPASRPPGSPRPTLIVLFLAAFGTFSLLDSAKGASGGGQGADPLVTPQRQGAPGAGHRPAVGVDVPLSRLRRVRDDAPRASGRTPRRVPRDLARRDPLVLGVRARRQGRRRSRRRQRRVRRPRTSSRRSRSAAPRCAACGTAT